MRVTTIAAVLAFASLGGAPASASSVYTRDGRFADFGAGGWSFDARVRPLASGAVAVAPNVRNEIDYRTVAPRGFADRERMWLWLGSESDCVFIAQPTSGGARRMSGCK
jgi:hypothetical protein